MHADFASKIWWRMKSDLARGEKQEKYRHILESGIEWGYTIALWLCFLLLYRLVCESSIRLRSAFGRLHEVALSIDRLDLSLSLVVLRFCGKQQTIISS
jgi:hypothetical protein